jgi:hypothetical protein
VANKLAEVRISTYEGKETENEIIGAVEGG